MAWTVYELQRQRGLLREQVAANLDVLAGSVTTKGPRRSGHNLTFKVAGVTRSTRSRHIRKRDLEKVRLMTARHQKLKELIHKLSELNWQILLRQSEESE